MSRCRPKRRVSSSVQLSRRGVRASMTGGRPRQADSWQPRSQLGAARIDDVMDRRADCSPRCCSDQPGRRTGGQPHPNQIATSGQRPSDLGECDVQGDMSSSIRLLLSAAKRRIEPFPRWPTRRLACLEAAGFANCVCGNVAGHSAGYAVAPAINSKHLRRIAVKQLCHEPDGETHP
jgi:hypothetical protein